MSKIKNWVIEQIESDSNVDLEFRELLAGFHKSCDKIEEAIDNFIDKDRIAKFSYEHDKWLDQNGGGFHYA